MKNKRDVILLAAILCVALVLFIVSRIPRSKNIEEYQADVTIAPDAITYLDDATTEPEQIIEEPNASPEPESTTLITIGLPGPTDSFGVPEKDEDNHNSDQLSEISEKTIIAEEQTDFQMTEGRLEEATGNSRPESTETSAGNEDNQNEHQAGAETDTGTETSTEESQKQSQDVAGPKPDSFGPGPVPPSVQKVRGYVRITVGQRQYGDLIPMDREKIITIRQDDSKINKIYISPEKVYMEDSTCENHDCIQEGEVSIDNYRSRVLSTFIICLPNEVTIEMIPIE